MFQIKLISKLIFVFVSFIRFVYVKDLREGIGEYCIMEVFQPECKSNEMIVIKHALYGRMKIGKCVVAQEFTMLTKDETTLGCYSDVMSIMDKKCSGKTRCEVRIPDNDLEQTKPFCYPGMKMYLEAEYQCVSVVDPEGRSSCSFTASTIFQYLRLIKSQSCGSASKTIKIETSLGKTIQLTIYNFQSSKIVQNNSNALPTIHNTCSKIGTINDKNSGKQEAICQNHERHKTLYSSKGNVAEIVLDGMKFEPDQIFLGFKAIGCSDIIPTEDSWIKRDGNSLTVGCYSSRKTWTLTCLHDKWIGTIGNCSHETAEGRDILKADSMYTANDFEKMTMSIEHQTLIIVAIVGFGLVVCLTIICAGVICVNKCYGKKSIFDPRMQEEASGSNGAGYYNTNLGTNCHRENETIVTKHFKEMTTNNQEHYEESKYFILDQETSNEHKPLA